MKKEADTRLPPTQDPRCGTAKGAFAHRNRNEKHCDPCAEAIRLYHKQYRINNPDKAYSQGRSVVVRGKAMTRLTHEYPDRFREILYEELEKERLAQERSSEEPS